jgi:hypothetical protein
MALVVIAAALAAGAGASTRVVENGAIVYSIAGPGTAGGHDGDLCLVDARGSSRRVTFGPDDDLGGDMSADGKRLVFARINGWDGNRPRATIRFLERGRQEVVAEGPYLDPDWAPDGRLVAVEEGAHASFIVLLQNERQLVYGRAPAWSPDGKRIAFSDLEDVRAPGIYLISPDGSDRRWIAAGVDPAWSPDGRRIAYSAGGIFVANSEGSETVRLTSASDWMPTWSPDGRRIAFVRGLFNGGNVWVMEADGSNQRQLTFSPEAERFPVWLPAGTEPPAPPAGRSCAPTLVGTPRPDRMSGTGTDDVLYGLAGDDRIAAGTGRDLVYAGDGRDRVDGGAGSDWISGGRRGDVIRAGEGDDVVDVRDGMRDFVSCGSGRDRALADHVDRTGGGCERVVRRKAS